MSAVRLGFSTVILFIFFAVVTAIIIAIVAAVVVGTRARKENISRPSADLPIPAEMPDASAAKKSLAEKLKEVRLARGMTQEFVAESLGVSRQAVSKWETGSADPSTGNLLALAKLYGVSAADLLE